MQIEIDTLRTLAGTMVATGNAVLEMLKALPPGHRILVPEPLPPGFALSLEEQLSIVAAVVGDYYGFSVRDLKSRDRQARLAWARHVFFFLSRKLLRAPAQRVALFAERKDHSTVLHGVTVVERRVSVDRSARLGVLMAEERTVKAFDGKLDAGLMLPNRLWLAQRLAARPGINLQDPFHIHGVLQEVRRA